MPKRAFEPWQARDRARALEKAFVYAGVIISTEEFIIAGSLRRRMDVVKDLDILLVDLPDDRWDLLTEVDGLKLKSMGDKKAQGTFEGIQVDLRRVPCESVGAALEYFTGPRQHNIGMRAKAKRQGYKLNEYGLYDRKTGARIAGRTERGIYDALGHPMKPPGERRNNPGHVPPAGVRKAAQRGLDLRREFGRGGTAVGIARARDLARGAGVSDDTIKRMASFFARHAVDKRPGWSNPSNPSNGYIAWLLWGGDAGRSWANKIKRQIEARRDNPPMRENPCDIWDLHTGSAWIVIPTNGVVKKNGDAVMGKGLAAQAAKRFPPRIVPAVRAQRGFIPEWEDPGLAAALGERLRLAKLSYPDDPYKWNKPFRFDDYRIFTFPTKFDYRQPSDLNLIEESAKRLADMIVNYEVAQLERKPLFARRAQERERIPERGRPFSVECPVFMPHVGTGAGKLDWADVEPIIHKYLGSLVTIVPPEPTKKKRAPRKKPTRLKPTRRRVAATARANPPVPEAWADAPAIGPKWVWPVIDRSWGKITKALAPFGEADWDKLLGCGAMGCVVPFVDDDRLVAKITTDDSEGTVVQAIIESGLDKYLDGLPRYEAVWRLTVPQAIKKGPPPRRGDAVRCAYLIVREDVEPWGQAGAVEYVQGLLRKGVVTMPRRKRDRIVTKMIPWYGPLWQAQMSGIRAAQSRAPGRDWEKWDENLTIVESFPETAMLAQTMRQLREHGVVLYDQHIDNLGFRVFSWPRGQQVHMVEWADGRRRPPLLSLDPGFSVLLDRDELNCKIVPWL